MKCKANEYLGKTFERLTVLEVVKTNKPRTYFKCRCQCGNELIVSLNHIQTGNTKSCGCLALETKRENGKRLSPIKYGIDTREDSLYMVYHNMIRRCYKQSNSSKYYKDKGIMVCDEWKNNYATFKEWALNNGYQKGLAIDRVNPNDDYKPSNCRFITVSENSRRVEHTKGVLCLSQTEKEEIYIKRTNGFKLKELALEYNVSLSTIKKITI